MQLQFASVGARSIFIVISILHVDVYVLRMFLFQNLPLLNTPHSDMVSGEYFKNLLSCRITFD